MNNINVLHQHLVIIYTFINFQVGVLNDLLKNFKKSLKFLSLKVGQV